MNKKDRDFFINNFENIKRLICKEKPNDYLDILEENTRLKNENEQLVKWIEKESIYEENIPTLKSTFPDDGAATIGNYILFSGKDTAIKGKLHLINILKYLFRIDEEQKWTCEDTPSFQYSINCITLDNGMFGIKKLEDYYKRLDKAKEIYEFLINWDVTKIWLKTYVYEEEDEDVTYIPFEERKFLFDEFLNLIEAAEYDKRIFLTIEHADNDKNYHIHFLYINEKDEVSSFQSYENLFNLVTNHKSFFEDII